MKLRAFFKIAVLGGFLISAFNYCPPGAQPVESKAMDCCRQKSGQCPTKSAPKVSCCTPERLAASGTQLVHLAPALVLYTIAQTVAAPRISIHRLARTLIRPAGPPGEFVIASAGNRAPPLA